MSHRLSFLLIISGIYFTSIAQKSVVDSLQQIIALGKSDRQQAKAMNTLATEYLRTDIEKAKAILYQTVSLGKTIKDSRALSASYSQLVTIHQNSGKQDSAAYYLSLLKAIANEAKGSDADIIKSNYYLTAGLFYKKSGNPKQALPYFRQSVSVTEKTGNKIGTAGQLLNLGNTYLDLGDYKNALQYHLKALKLFEEAGNKRGESFCYQSISNSLAELKQYDNAQKYAQKSIQLKTELNDKRGIGTAQDGLGNIYMGLTNYDKALQHFNAALAIAKELNLVTEQAKTYFNIGKAYAAKKNVKAAIANFKQSKLLAKQLGDNATSSAADIELLALQKNTSTQESEKKIFNSLKTFSEAGDRIKEATGYKNAADFYAANALYDKALQYTNKYHQLNDSIQNSELQLQLKKMEQQYNIEKKEKEIAILKKDKQLNVAELEKQKVFQYGALLFLTLVIVIGFLIINRYRAVNRAKRQIEMEKMRNNIARDLHDDIGSTVSSINILSNVLLQQKNDEKNISSNLQKIKKHSAAIMENMSDMVWAINPVNDTVEKVIYRMKEFAAEILEPLNITYNFEMKGDIASVKLDPAKRKNFFLIFKEALNNAAKYSHCNKIDIVIEYDGKNLQLNIRDDGEGFDEATARQGNGIRNIKERAKEMPAALNYKTTIGNGTSVLLDVPVT